MFARVVVGLLVLHEAGGYIPPPPGPQTKRYILKIAAGGNQGNWTRNRQVLSEIYRVGVGRNEALEWKTIKMERTVQQDRPWNGTKRTFYVFFRKTLSLSNANGKRNGPFLENCLDAYHNYYIISNSAHKSPSLVHYRWCASIGKCLSVHETCPLFGVQRLSPIREL